ncbi:MAG: Lrp/AsnC ligand binding domain-containing protein, partial [Nitrososphaerota archaeon]
VHIISGDWDLLIKVRAEDVETRGKFVIDKLRTVKGIEQTLTCMVFDSTKETPNVDIPNAKELIVRQGKSRK